MARFINSIIQAAEYVESGIETNTDVHCRHHDELPPCTGFLTIRRQDIPASIHWNCQRCSEAGVLSGLDDKFGQIHIFPRHSPPTIDQNSYVGSMINQKNKIDHWLGGVDPAWRNVPRETIDAFNRVVKIEDGPTIINEGLSIEDLSDSVVLKHARLFLTELLSEKIKLTVKGNLNLKFVDQMCETFEWPDYDVSRFRKYKKTIKEEEFLPLNFMHIILKLSGFVRKYRGHLIITKRGKALLQDARAGELQSTLFKATYNKFNLAYLDGVPIGSAFQQQIGFTIFLIGRKAANWISLEELLRQTVVPVDEIFSVRPDFPEWAFESRVIKTLMWFGLLETKRLTEQSVYPAKFQVRKMKIFDKMLSYD